MVYSDEKVPKTEKAEEFPDEDVVDCNEDECKDEYEDVFDDMDLDDECPADDDYDENDDDDDDFGDGICITFVLKSFYIAVVLCFWIIFLYDCT